MPKKVVLYHSPACQPCHQALAYLEESGIAFVSKDITVNPDYIQELIALGSQGTPTLLIDDQVLIGWDPRRFRELWSSS